MNVAPMDEVVCSDMQTPSRKRRRVDDVFTCKLHVENGPVMRSVPSAAEFACVPTPQQRASLGSALSSVPVWPMHAMYPGQMLSDVCSVEVVQGDNVAMPVSWCEEPSLPGFEPYWSLMGNSPPGFA